MTEKVKWEIRDSEGKLLAYQMGSPDSMPPLIREIKEYLDRERTE